MKKKLITIFAVIALVAVLATVFVACNKGYKWHSVGGGDATAEVKSNGGYVVKQGNYLYMINGYSGADQDNTFGTPVKQSIVRVEIKDGAIDNSTAVVVAPKSVYNSSSKSGGIAIFGDWIYYATNNYEKDKNGIVSTTDSDFMRTKIDGSATQLIATINSRSVEYLFTPTRVWYFANNTLSYVDFSGMKNGGDITNGKGAVKGQLGYTISSVAWDYEVDKIFFTRSATDTTTSLTYNELCSIDKSGANEQVLATYNTYLAKGEKAVDNGQKVFTFTLLDVAKEESGATIYYTKSYKAGSSSPSAGTFMNKVAGSFKVADEKRLTTNAVTTIYPLGYADGALAYNTQSVYCWYNGENEEDPVQVTNSSKTVWFAAGGNAYYTASSSASELYEISYREKSNVEVVFSEGMKVDWLPLDGVEDGDFKASFFFATSDNNYLHYVNYMSEDTKSTMIGIYLPGDEPKEEEK